ncbi:MAG: capsule assembly Wzi family protein [Gammaproteobacteria bacterium]|nr:capsule assembly Wzi family protein [Gammaproteobacteria bacterium]
MRTTSRNTFIALALLVSSTTLAAPLAAPGDVGLRHDIQVLADYGAISGPVTTWPLSWDAVLADLEKVKADNTVLPNAVIPTYDRILARAQREAARGEFGFSGGLAAAQDPVQIRGFANTPREEGEVGAGVSWFSQYVSIDLNATYADQPVDGEEFRADGSQLGLDFGNWSFAASTMDRWWGPGWDGSLILSNNARPIPSFTIGRNRTSAFESKWLSWIGPWDLQVLWGQLEEERPVPNAKFWGMRVNFRPLKGLEIGLSRSAQWCGDGRPCGADVFWDLLLGRDNIGDDGTTEENEPGNQMGGFDVRWTNLWFGTPVSFYGQLIGEDEAGGFPSRYLAQFGLEGSGITRGQTSYRWFVEGAATSCDALKSNVGYGCAYRNTNLYPAGYTYYRRIIGHGLDNDALVYSAGFIVVNADGNAWNVLARLGELNRVGPDANHSVAPLPQDLASIDIQYSFPSRIGTFDLGAGYERREELASGIETSDTRGFLRWTSPARTR